MKAFFQFCGRTTLIQRLAALSAALLVLAIFGQVAKQNLEREHPCVAYGPERVSYYQKLGEVTIPVYEKPCLERR